MNETKSNHKMPARSSAHDYAPGLANLLDESGRTGASDGQEILRLRERHANRPTVRAIPRRRHRPDCGLVESGSHDFVFQFAGVAPASLVALPGCGKSA
jgi:hypothetical protein